MITPVKVTGKGSGRPINTPRPSAPLSRVNRFNLLLIFDEFTDANGTALDDHTIAPTNISPPSSWTSSVGHEALFDIQSNKASLSSGAGSITTVVESGAADVTITGEKSQTLAGGAWAGLCARYSDNTHYWRASIHPNGNTLRITERDGGDVQRASVAFANTEGETHDLKIVTSGQTITASVDDDAASVSYGLASLNETEAQHGITDSRSGGINTTDDFRISL